MNADQRKSRQVRKAQMGADRLSEFELISRFFAPLTAGEPGALGLLDDAAIVSLASGHRLVVTTDTVVSEVHFLPSDPPDSIAAKALAVNLSDLAAMGAVPRAYTLSLVLPEAWDWNLAESWLERFADRLAQDQRAMGIHLIGGDTVVSPGPLSIAVTALGVVGEGEELRRSTARAGDVVYVSGTIGDAALGLRCVLGELAGLPTDFVNTLVNRYRFPQPRIDVGRQLSGVAHSAADVSDGLLADIGHICTASNVSAVIEAPLVPLSLPVRTAIAFNSDLLAVALTGGDDYELVFTAPAASELAIRSISNDLDTCLTAIGRISARDSDSPKQLVGLLGADGLPIDIGRTGYRHL